MKAKDLRSMSKADLNSKMVELRKEMIKHNAQISTGTTPKSPGQVKQIKKTIAKILTIFTEKQSKLGDEKFPSVSKQNEEVSKAPKEATKETKSKEKKETSKTEVKK